jgi:hypothetical protein
MSEVFVPFRPAGQGSKAEPAPARPRPTRIARQLALAHELQRRIDSGEFRNQATLARALGFSRERISKICGLLLLAPQVQEAILFGEHLGPFTSQTTERDLHRSILCHDDWARQADAWERYFSPLTGSATVAAASALK